MNLNAKLATVLFLALLVPVLTVNASPPDAPAFCGRYTLVGISGNELPTQLWESPEEDQECLEEVVSGTLLLGDNGDWSALVEGREVCKDQGHIKHDGTSTWGVLCGSYELSGDRIELRFLESVLSGNIPTSGKELVLEESGVGQYEGQVLEYVFLRD